MDHITAQNLVGAMEECMRAASIRAVESYWLGFDHGYDGSGWDAGELDGRDLDEYTMGFRDGRRQARDPLTGEG